MGGGDGGLAEGHRDLVEAADDVADGIEAGHAGLLVEVDAQVAIAGIQADPGKQVAMSLVAQVRVDGIERLVGALSVAVAAALAVEFERAAGGEHADAELAGALADEPAEPDPLHAPAHHDVE